MSVCVCVRVCVCVYCVCVMYHAFKISARAQVEVLSTGSNGTLKPLTPLSHGGKLYSKSALDMTAEPGGVYQGMPRHLVCART